MWKEWHQQVCCTVFVGDIIFSSLCTIYRKCAESSSGGYKTQSHSLQFCDLTLLDAVGEGKLPPQETIVLRGVGKDNDLWFNSHRFCGKILQNKIRT